MKPKQKLQTVAVNMGTEGETKLSLFEGTTVNYECSTKGYPMAGIQVGIHKYGQELADGALLCSVLNESKETVLSQTRISMADVDEGQYVYIPFDNYRQCIGTVNVEFKYIGAADESCALAANTVILDDAVTYVNGLASDVSLKSYYVYKLDYYPLVFDLLTGLMLFAGVFLLGKANIRPGRDQSRCKEEAADE